MFFPDSMEMQGLFNAVAKSNGHSQGRIFRQGSGGGEKTRAVFRVVGYRFPHYGKTATELGGQPGSFDRSIENTWNRLNLFLRR